MSLEHISDTARWMAVYRAMETERPDAIFRDPFAARLAGAEGERIVDALPSGRAMAWTMIVRTALIDELLLAEMERSRIDVVVNLAAGLDARPWRLDLPSDLTWVDVDLPGILEYKLEALAGEEPRCGYRAEHADLTDPGTRRRVLTEIGRLGERVVVITEGLLIYLTDEQVTDLARDLHGVATVHTWIIDLASPRLLQFVQRSWGKDVGRARAPFRFAPAEGTAFFRPLGWREGEYRSISEEGHRLGREMRGAWLWRPLSALMPAKRKEEYRRMSGVVRLERMVAAGLEPATSTM